MAGTPGSGPGRLQDPGGPGRLGPHGVWETGFGHGKPGQSGRPGVDGWVGWPLFLFLLFFLLFPRGLPVRVRLTGLMPASLWIPLDSLPLLRTFGWTSLCLASGDRCDDLIHLRRLLEADPCQAPPSSAWHRDHRCGRPVFEMHRCDLDLCAFVSLDFLLLVFCIHGMLCLRCAPFEFGLLLDGCLHFHHVLLCAMPAHIIIAAACWIRPPREGVTDDVCRTGNVDDFNPELVQLAVPACTSAGGSHSSDMFSATSWRWPTQWALFEGSPAWTFGGDYGGGSSNRPGRGNTSKRRSTKSLKTPKSVTC